MSTRADLLPADSPNGLSVYYDFAELPDHCPADVDGLWFSGRWTGNDDFFLTAQEIRYLLAHADVLLRALPKDKYAHLVGGPKEAKR